MCSLAIQLATPPHRYCARDWHLGWLPHIGWRPLRCCMPAFADFYMPCSLHVGSLTLPRIAPIPTLSPTQRVLSCPPFLLHLTAAGLQAAGTAATAASSSSSTTGSSSSTRSRRPSSSSSRVVPPAVEGLTLVVLVVPPNTLQCQAVKRGACHPHRSTRCHQGPCLQLCR